MKLEHMKDFIAEVRLTIEAKWETCIGLNERRVFIQYQCNIYTEKLLTDHETELERLTNYEIENEHLLLLIQKRNDMFHKYLDLKSKANDPGRFLNRGGVVSY